jgi:uncharacterized protein (TIGR02466 family)
MKLRRRSVAGALGLVSVPISPELSVAFGTALSLRTVANFAALNPELEQAILKRRDQGIANQVSNIGGWQSLPDFLDWPEPAIGQLKMEMDRGLQQIGAMPTVLERRIEPSKRVSYQAYGWANVNGGGDYNMLHVHPGCDWSVVYCVATGNPSDDNPMSGRIELRDPRPAAVFANMPGSKAGEPMLIKPKPGLMLIFPAWIEHQVHPFTGEGLRISIAINVTLDKN